MKIRRNPKFHLVVFVKVRFCLTIFSDCFLFVLRLTFRHNNVRPQEIAYTVLKNLVTISLRDLLCNAVLYL